MIIGYGIIAVPTGIVSAEYASAKENIKEDEGRCCANCATEVLREDAVYCRKCGERLEGFDL